MAEQARTPFPWMIFVILKMVIQKLDILSAFNMALTNSHLRKRVKEYYRHVIQLDVEIPSRITVKTRNEVEFVMVFDAGYWRLGSATTYNVDGTDMRFTHIENDRSVMFANNREPVGAMMRMLGFIRDTFECTFGNVSMEPRSIEWLKANAPEFFNGVSCRQLCIGRGDVEEGDIENAMGMFTAPDLRLKCRLVQRFDLLKKISTAHLKITEKWVTFSKLKMFDSTRVKILQSFLESSDIKRLVDMWRGSDFPFPKMEYLIVGHGAHEYRKYEVLSGCPLFQARERPAALVRYLRLPTCERITKTGIDIVGGSGEVATIYFDAKDKIHFVVWAVAEANMVAQRLRARP